MIPFNKPYMTGKEAHYMYQAVFNGHISGNGSLTKKCQTYFKERWGFKHCLLTTSCTDALEMAAILADIIPGDEVIMPSYTFVSTAIAFVRQGAKIVFADSHVDHPGIDEASIERLITPRTKAIVPVHYAGVACDMDVIMDIAKRHNLLVIEDAAQAVDSYYKGRPLGSIGHIGCFSFHETKNIQCGEGGMLCINDDRFAKRAEIIWEKGTNRAEFFRGEVNKYGWVDVGSSFLPADYVAGFLLAQLEHLDEIQTRRRTIWEAYHQHFSHNASFGQKLPHIPSYATNNGHMFYMVFPSIDQRTEFINIHKAKEINPVFHYLSLHKSPYYTEKYTGAELPNADRYSNCLVRMPLYYELDIEKVIGKL